MPGRSKILVVDDEPGLVQAISLRLRAKGYDVVSASDGKEAVDVFLKERPNLVLMDIHLPEMDGIAAMGEMLDRDPEMGVIVFTADHNRERAELAMERGACDFVPKPIDFNYLEDSIWASLALRGEFMPPAERSP